MSTRLTKAMREHILEEMLRHRFRDEFLAIVKEQARIANVVYEDVFKKKVRDQMEALPDGWLPEVQGINVRLGEHYNYFAFNGVGRSYAISHGIDRVLMRSDEEPEAILRRIPHSKESGCLEVYDHDHKLTLDYGKNVHRRSVDFIGAYQKAAGEANAALNSFSNTRTLLKAWPECEPFLPTVEETKLRLPAVKTEALNELFKLPVAA